MHTDKFKTNQLVIASDHAGFELKSQLIEHLHALGRQVTDLGTQDLKSVDYPIFAALLARHITNHHGSLGILICGTGIGVCMSANRFPGVRAALCTSVYMASMARAHNDANVLCLGGRVIGLGEAKNILDTFLTTDFEAGRHARRVQQIDTILDRKDP